MNNFRKINLQLFAEDSGSDIGGDNLSQEQTTKENDEATVKSYSEEELASIKEQWEKEKETEYNKKLKDEITKAIEEEKRLSKLSKDEKDAEEKQKLLSKIEILEKEKELNILKEKALNTLSEQKLPNSFLELVLGADENATNQNISNLKTEFDKAVQMQVEERLKGKTPASGGNTDEQGNAQVEFKNALRGIFK